MEVERRLSSSLRRKPLSDCSNVVSGTGRNPPSSWSKSVTALLKPPKSSRSAAIAAANTTAINKSNTASITASSSLKSHTSIGSNISPDACTFLSDPPLPPTPFSGSDDRDRKKLRIPAAESQRRDTKARKDRSKMVLKTPIAEASNTSTTWTLELSSSASDNCHQSRPSTLQSKNTDAQVRNDKGKMVIRTFNIKASEPVTPHVAHLITSSSACGLHNQQKLKFLTVNNQRSPRRRKHADGTTILPLSCPPGKRTKDKGVKPDDSGVKKQLGSLADPLPLHEKKRSGDKQDDAIHGMPQEEIERLRSYYADVDAFELPEEVAPEIDFD